MIFGTAGKTRVVHEEPKALQADASPPEMLVAVQPAPPLALGVVEVDRQDAPGPHRRLEGRQRVPVRGRRREVVPGGMTVAGVEADTEAGRCADPPEDRAEVREVPGQDRPRACGVLEADQGRPLPRPLLEPVERLGDPRQPGLHPGAHVRPGVGDDAREPQRLRPAKLLEERLARPLQKRRVRRCEVDQVGAVGDHRRDPGPGLLRSEAGRFGRRKRGRLPAGRVLREDLHRGAAGLHPAPERQRRPAGDADVRPDQG